MTITSWLYPTDVGPNDLLRLTAVLSDEERAHAARHRQQRDRNRFTARRATLRLLLADVLGCDPKELAFELGPHGKPVVQGNGELTFNVSHSSGLGLCVIARGIAIGCDIEHRNPALADADVARRLFAPEEWRSLQSLQGEAWIDGFFNCWTRKEAFIKALGLGLSHPLDAFAVSLVPGEPAALLRGGEGWSLAALAIAPGWTAAICAVGDAADDCLPPRIYPQFQRDLE